MTKIAMGARERERERERSLLTIKKGKHNALSGHTASGCSGSSICRGFGIPNRSPDALVQKAGPDHPFPIVASQGKKPRGSNPTRPPRRNACGASVPAPLSGDALFSEEGPGIVVVVSCT
jgi:hypothetical protein